MLQVVDNLAPNEDDDQSSHSRTESEGHDEKGQARDFVAKDLMAKGIGYDASDMFIDDSEAVSSF